MLCSFLRRSGIARGNVGDELISALWCAFANRHLLAHTFYLTFLFSRRASPSFLPVLVSDLAKIGGRAELGV